jgi:hypothetical protein
MMLLILVWQTTVDCWTKTINATVNAATNSVFALIVALESVVKKDMPVMDAGPQTKTKIIMLCVLRITDFFNAEPKAPLFMTLIVWHLIAEQISKSMTSLGAWKSTLIPMMDG